MRTIALREEKAKIAKYSDQNTTEHDPTQYSNQNTTEHDPTQHSDQNDKRQPYNDHTRPNTNPTQPYATEHNLNKKVDQQKRPKVAKHDQTSATNTMRLHKTPPLP
uniref:Uncharacterized protein n=1 Tax=Arundo donax TaxID=35708 RepID=A0A0A9B725_ARUDO